jgi:hypothetical protein
VKPPTCGELDADVLGADGLGVGEVLALAGASGVGGVKDSLGAETEIGTGDVGIACAVAGPADELMDGGCARAESAGAAALWVQAVAAASTAANATAALTARRPRQWLATARG